MQVHPLRDQLLAEVHARPSTPIEPPMCVARVAALSGQDGAERDRLHMAALCHAAGAEVPSPGMRWWSAESEGWQLRWERHSEFSTWTLLRSPDAPDGGLLAPLSPDWVRDIPGEILVMTQVDLQLVHPASSRTWPGTTLSVRCCWAAPRRCIRISGPIPTACTRFDVRLRTDDPVLIGRLALSLLEIETYRLMALLSFPVAGEATAQLREIEAEAGSLAGRISEELGVEDDRALLSRLVALSGRMEALSASTGFRFAAGDAYYEIIQNRIASLAEAPLPGLQTIAQFMERRLGPAMRTCASVAERERAVIARIARAGQMLNTRIELVTQAINADLLHSMNRRALAQLRLQRTVEGLSVAAIAYYLLSLLTYPLQALRSIWPDFQPSLAAALIAPVLVLTVWLGIRRLRRRIDREAGEML
jgi:uncharacterized membrane-anchored protein